MEIIKHRIKKDNINIYHLTDPHTGAENQRTKELKELVDVIDKDPIGYWVGGGDYIEAITMTDPRFSPGELQNKYKLKDLSDLPRKQMKEFFDIIKPIKDKCLGLLIGNHEEQYIRRNHFNVYDYLANELMGHPELKMGQNGYLLLTLGKNATRNVKIFATHGEGLSTSPDDGAVMTSFLRLVSDKVADIYFAGHVHRLLETSTTLIDIDSAGNLYKTKKIYVIGGAWLDKYHIGTSGYFESKRGYDTVSGYVKVNVSTSNHDHRVKINTFKVEL